MKKLLWVGLLAVVLIGAYKLGAWTVTRQTVQVANEPQKEQEDGVVALGVLNLPVERQLWNEILSDARYREGSDDAPVTIVAYLDRRGCELCVDFLNNTLALIRVNYIEKGKVRYLELPYQETDSNGKLALSGHARAAGISKNPSFFISYYKLEGAQPYISFESLIEKALAEVK